MTEILFFRTSGSGYFVTRGGAPETKKNEFGPPLPFYNPCKKFMPGHGDAIVVVTQVRTTKCMFQVAVN